MTKKNKELFTYGLLAVGAVLLYQNMQKSNNNNNQGGNNNYNQGGYNNYPNQYAPPPNTNQQWWQGLVAQAPQYIDTIMSLINSGQANSGEQAFAMIPGTNTTYNDYYMNQVP